MQITLFWASFALSFAPAVLAQGTATTSAASSTTSAAPKCSASTIATICGYKGPGPAFGVASSGREYCMQYCIERGNCNFFIFNPGNPTTGSGTCWLYPGEQYDENIAQKTCENGGSPYLTVYGEPTCEGTSTSPGDCPATASPSAVATGCGYPAPETCFSTCYASSGASNCLGLCAKADDCAYAVFNPRTESLSPYTSGTCWVYTNGTYDPKLMTTCSGKPEQYVYNNVCPKHAKPSGSAPSSAASSATNAPASTGAVSGADSQQSQSGPGTVKKDSAADKFAPVAFLFCLSMTVGITGLML